MIDLFLAASELMNETDGGGRNAQYLFVAPQLLPSPWPYNTPAPTPATQQLDWLNSFAAVFAGFAKNSAGTGPSPDSETGQKVAVFSYN